MFSLFAHLINLKKQLYFITMEKKQLIESLENWQAERYPKESRDAMKQSLFEAIAEGNIDFSKKLGFTVPIFSPEFMRMSEKEEGLIIDLLNISEGDLYRIQKSNRADWAEARPKKNIFALKKEISSSLKGLSIFAGFTDGKYVNKKFTPGVLIKSTFKVVESEKRIPDEYAVMVPDTINQIAVYKLTGSRYMIMLRVKGNDNLLLFPLTKSSFDLAFVLE